MLAANAHPKVVQERPGYASIAMTFDIYSHLIPSLQREAAAKLDVILGSSGKRGAVRPDSGS